MMGRAFECSDGKKKKQMGQLSNARSKRMEGADERRWYQKVLETFLRCARAEECFCTPPLEGWCRPN